MATKTPVQYIKCTADQYNSLKSGVTVNGHKFNEMAYYYVVDTNNNTAKLYIGEILLSNVEGGSTDITTGGHNFWEGSPLPTKELGSKYKENDVFIELKTVIDTTVTPNKESVLRTAYYLSKKSDTDSTLVWKAMAGNYSAKNVYFEKDNFIFTASVGTATVSGTSTTTKNAKGKNLEEFFTDLFAKDAYPASGNSRDFPSLSISFPANDKQGGRQKSGEVGSEFDYPTATLKVSDVGSYAYGPNTGIKFEAGKVSFSQGTTIGTALATTSNESEMVKDSTLSLTATDAASDNNAARYTDTQKVYHFWASGDYTQGAAPKKRLGDVLDNFEETETVKWAYRIPAGTANVATNTNTYATRTGYRKMFAGGLTEDITKMTGDENQSKENKQSSAIRGLAKSEKAQVYTAIPSDTTGFIFSVGQVAQVVFAYPESLTTNTPTFYYKPGAWGECPSSTMPFIKNTIQVADARGGDNGLINYTVYTYTPQQALDAAQTWFGVKF